MKERLLAIGLVFALALALPSWCLADEEGVFGEEAGEIALEMNQLGDADSGEDEAIDKENVGEDINLFPDEEKFAWAKVFLDVSADADYAEAVAYLAGVGIIKGDENGKFNPNSAITRAETATIICRLMGTENEARANRRQMYDDVPTTHWALGYISQATELGIFNGDGNGKFRPGDNVTYQEMIKILVCACGYESEAQQSGSWPNGYIAVAENLGITSGMRFRQTADASRSAVAQLIYNIMR